MPQTLVQEVLLALLAQNVGVVLVDLQQRCIRFQSALWKNLSIKIGNK